MGETVDFEKIFDILRDEYGAFIGLGEDEGATINIRRNPDEPGKWTCTLVADGEAYVNGHWIPLDTVTGADIESMKAYVFEWLIGPGGIPSDRVYEKRVFSEQIDTCDCPYIPSFTHIALKELSHDSAYLLKNREYLSKFFSNAELMHAVRFMEKLGKIPMAPFVEKFARTK